MDKNTKLSKTDGIESKNIDSKIGKSKIPERNTTVRKQNAGKEVLKKYNDLNGQFSKPKQAKTAIVRSFSFAAVSKKFNMETDCSQPLDQGSKINSKVDTDLFDNIPGTRNVEDCKEPSGQEIQSTTLEEYTQSPIKRKLSIKTSVHPPIYEAHAGIPFLSSPKRTGPNPFSLGEKQRQSSRRSKTGVPSKSNLNSRPPIAETAGATNFRPFVRKVQSNEVKPKTIVTQKSKSRKEVTSVHQELDDLATSVQNAQVVPRKYDGHSGISFKLRQLPRTSKNPFTIDTSSEESGSHCSRS